MPLQGSFGVYVQGPGTWSTLVSLADGTKFDRLDLITPLGRGRTCTVRRARWSDRSKREIASTWTKLGDEGEISVVAKVVPAECVSSVAREYFMYTQVVPRLSPAAQAYLLKFSGLYRSGWDGGGFVLVMEDAGDLFPIKEFSSYSSETKPGQGRPPFIAPPEVF
ncbi:BQ5605_C003g02383 [Microbotryum silenes-dioicae]|uniref:BQ5605_C003g02383 protein n=1 Tax=Microbotryum silenes-dioicae TaxID=796604 RepID=A0A2X0M5J1_9BASI|nr:BQ5605_C003g02383 [Microbotryum silenes-dioicae]